MVPLAMVHPHRTRCKREGNAAGTPLSNAYANGMGMQLVPRHRTQTRGGCGWHILIERKREDAAATPSSNAYAKETRMWLAHPLHRTRHERELVVVATPMLHQTRETRWWRHHPCPPCRNARLPSPNARHCLNTHLPLSSPSLPPQNSYEVP